MRVVQGRPRDDLGGGWLWYTLLVPPLAWLLHVAVMYPLVLASCAQGSALVLHLFTVFTAAPIALAWWVAHRIARDTAFPRDAREQRAHFLGRAARISAPLFLAITVVEWVPVLLVDPCL